MSATRSFLTHELKLQLRGPRFYLIGSLYAVGCLLPVVYLVLSRNRSDQLLGAATYAAELAATQPCLTAILAALLSIGALHRERAEGSFAVVSLTPMTHSGYLLRRWISILGLIVPLTLLPPIVAVALAALAGVAPGDPATFFWPWLLHTLPLALSSSALAIGLGTIAGGTLAALILGGTAYFVFFALANSLLVHFGHRLPGFQDWIGGEGLAGAIATVRWGVHWLTPVSDAPFDPRAAALQQLSSGAIFVGLSALALGLSTAYLRRTRPDVRPWPIRPDHPLRSFLRIGNRVREHAVPDPGLSLRDRLFVVFGVALFVASIAFTIVSHESYRRRGMERYRAELGGGAEPTPHAVLTERMAIRGRIESSGRLEVRVEAEFRNRGKTSVEQLAFSLNPRLQILSVSSDPGSASSTAEWDRLLVRLTPPLAGGARRRLELHIAGAPASDHLHQIGGSVGFIDRFRRYLEASYAREIPALARSWSERAVSRRRVDLGAQELAPVLRYTPWTLTPPPRFLGQPGKIVPPETVSPLLELELELQAPLEMFLADSCGDVSSPRDGVQLLRGGCRLPLSALRVVGGTGYATVPAAGVATFAVLESHRAAGELHRASLIEAAQLAGSVWPGTDPIRHSVVLEWPPRFDVAPWRSMLSGRRFDATQPGVVSAGKLMLIPERTLVRIEPIEAGELAASAVASELLARRAVIPSEQLFFKHLFRWLTHSRVGGASRSAVLSGPPIGWGRQQLSVPLLEAAAWNATSWRVKLPALMVDVERRVGTRKLMEAIGEFLASPEEQSGSAREFFAILAARSGVRLEATYLDYVAGSELPQLTLADVRLEHSGGLWVVSGRLVNGGGGSTVCPLVLRTELDLTSVDVTVGPRSSVPVRMSSRHRPQTLLIDPDRRCFRFEPRPRGENIDRIDLREAS